jgi:hypothetical protein
MPRQLSLFKGKRQRGVQPPAALEFETQCVIADTLERWAQCDWRWTHFPSGELRNKITAARLKRMGTKRGLPDFLFFPTTTLLVHFLELKRKGGIITDEQQSWADWCNAVGYPHAIAYDFDGAMAVLKHWGVLRVSVTV